MGHPTLSFEDIRQRNEDIVAYANRHPEVTKTALGIKYGVTRETIRLILDRSRRRAERNQRLGGDSRARIDCRTNRSAPSGRAL
jgi:hypothetical protein